MFQGCVSTSEVSEFVEQSVARHGRLLISILEDIQKHYTYLPEEALREVAKRLKIPLIDVYGVATFYHAFSLHPQGRHVVTVCLGTACHVRGGERIADVLSRELKVMPGETTRDRNFTLQTVNCLGVCALGPVVVIDGEYHGTMNPGKVVSLLKKYQSKEKKEKKDGKN